MKWHLFNFSESRICPNIYRMFRSVDWTHDMIIVKSHLLIWHNRKLCALTNAPPVQSTQTDQWLSTLFHANYSAPQVYVLHPRQFIFALSWRRRSFLKILQSTERKEAYFETFFVYLMMINVVVKTCLHQKIIKNSNLIQAMKNSVCPKAKVIRTPNFSESRFCPNIYRMFRSVHRTHDMIIVKWHEVTLIQFFGKPDLSEYLPNVPKCGLNTRHDNREVALTHLTQAQTLRSDKCATGSIHTNGSMTINVIPC